MSRHGFEMNLPDSTELQELIRLCIKGDRKAQERLFKVSYPLSLSVCRRYTRDLEEAQSVVNDGMLKVFQELDHYSPDFSFGGWLRRIMVNSAINNYLRINHLGLFLRSLYWHPLSKQGLIQDKIHGLELGLGVSVFLGR